MFGNSGQAGRKKGVRSSIPFLLFLPIMAIFAANLWCAYQSRTIFMKQGFISQSDNPSLFRNIVIGNIVALAISGFAMINAFIHAAAGS